MEKISGILKAVFSDDKKVKAIVFIGIAGMGMILLSGFFSGSNKDSAKTDKEDKGISENTDSEIEEYTKKAEDKLTALLSSIQGVGEVEIMVNVSSTKEYVYADEEKSDISKNSDSYSENKENNYFIIEKNGEKEALIKKINTPEISGVVIVCEGGDSNVVKENIYKSVSVAFGIPSSKIYVAKIK